MAIEKKEPKENKEEEEFIEEEDYEEEEEELESGEQSTAEDSTDKKDKLVIRRNIFVDMWAFLGMHATNIDIMKTIRRADDRQFTPGMDVNGMVSEDPAEGELGMKERTQLALMTIRTNLWQPPKEELEKTLEKVKKEEIDLLKKGIKRRGGRLNKEQKEQLDEEVQNTGLEELKTSDIDKQRLVMKMFTHKKKKDGSKTKLRWRGTIEESVTKEMHNSLGSKHPLTFFSIILPGYDYVVNIEQNRRYWALAPIFSFNYWDEKNQKMWYVVIKQRFISIGIDFDVYADGRKIAFLDGKLIGLGGNSNVKIYDETLAKDKKFGDVLILFTSTVGYQRVIRRNLKKRMKSIMNDGNRVIIIEDEEFWMMKNPRRLIR